MIFGLDAQALPEDYIALEAVSVVKALDEDGDPRLVLRVTPSLSSWEAMGMLDIALSTIRGDLMAGFEKEDPEDPNE